MTVRNLIVITTYFMLSSQTVSASTDELDAAVMAATKFAIAAMPTEQRRLLAEAGYDYWQNFQSRIPRASPSELEWLQSEFSSNNSERHFRASQTQTYALDQLTMIAETCASAFKNLTTADYQDYKLLEMYHWTKSLHCYSSPTSLLEYLKTAQLSDGRWDGTFSVLHFPTFHRTVTGPLANSIINERH